jgi:hypothetical protein
MPAPVDPLRAALFLMGAFVLAGAAHTAWLRSPRSRALAIPIDGGRTWRGRRLLGDNKMIRGFVAMVPAAAAAFALLGMLVGSAAHGLWDLSVAQYAALGAWAGLGFMLGELPNSFIKRQLGVAPGHAPHSRGWALAGFVVDRLDSIAGMLAAVSLVVPTPWTTWLWVVAIGPFIHWTFSATLHHLGVKARHA